MRVRIDCYLGDDSRLDLSFLKNRKGWLFGTGLYIEFMLKGIYQQEVFFEVQGDEESVAVSHYSWNRFFLNLKKTGEVHFIVKEGQKEVVRETMLFKVFYLDVPLVVSVPDLMHHPVADIRYFANRLSENLINTTRFVLFTPSFIRSCRNSYGSEQFFKLYDMVFSIITERGIDLIITPFGSTAYPMDMIKTDWRGILLDFIEHCRKYRVVWDFSSGLRQKELGGMVDSVSNRFNQTVTLIVPPKSVDRCGGEGIAGQIKVCKTIGHIASENERGYKIARMPAPVMNKKFGLPDVSFFAVQSFVQKATQLRWGSELVLDIPPRQMKRFRFSALKAVSKGYAEGRRT